MQSVQSVPWVVGAVAVLCVINTALLLLVGGAVALIVVALRPWRRHQADRHAPLAPETHTCGALDPVSDPAYNMREIAKQSILLEEHLVERAKYCRDCIVKHFLHIIGLAEEAQMLACDSAPKYPLLAESVEFYKAEFDAWLRIAPDPEGAEASEERLRIAGELRAFRKKLVAAYVLSAPPP